jgi:shikimate dehydrogenase
MREPRALIGPRTLVGLIGANIGQSLSPALHEDAFAAAGIVGSYHLMDVDTLPGRTLADLVAAARTVGFLGINVTFPFKEAVVPLLDELSEEAAQIGAVNTVTIGRDGRLAGYNTDRIGFRASFEETLGAGAVAGKTALLIGAGGAGRAVAFALIDLGVETLLIHDQDGARAAGLIDTLATHFGPRRVRAAHDPAAALADVAGVVNATPVGMRGIPGNPVSMPAVEARHWVADVIYTPLETELVEGARAKGARAFGGGGMCVHQAAAAFRLFTGLTPDVARMHRVFVDAAAARDAQTAYAR